MRDCRVCGKHTVTADKGPATCPTCRRAKALVAKRRYQHSPKGQATARAREEREDVKEKRRQFSRSQRGKLNHAKYQATEKGKVASRKRARKYHASEDGKRKDAERHLKTKDQPERIEQRRQANERYRQTDKCRAKKRRDYARRKAAIVPDRIVTAEDWLEIQAQHKHRCHYCGKRKVLTLDHVIPLSKGGRHVKENIVPACRSCNSKKNNKVILLL